MGSFNEVYIRFPVTTSKMCLISFLEDKCFGSYLQSQGLHHTIICMPDVFTK